MESTVTQETTVEQTSEMQKGGLASLAEALQRKGLRLLSVLHRGQRGVTGLETAILLTSFVVASSALGAAYVNSTFGLNEKVQTVAMGTIDSIIEEAQPYIDIQRLTGPEGAPSSEQQTLDLAELDSALAAALDDAPRTIEFQRNGTAVVSIDLSAVGMAGVVDVATALEASLGSELPYTIEAVPGKRMFLRMELQPPFTVGG